jgi:hypothetical protein
LPPSLWFGFFLKKVFSIFSQLDSHTRGWLVGMYVHNM